MDIQSKGTAPMHAQHSKSSGKMMNTINKQYNLYNKKN
jgi:hypothetical protein